MPALTRKQKYKTGMLSSITFFYQDVILKALASKEPIADEEFLLDKLLLTNEELKEIRRTNFFAVG